MDVKIDYTIISCSSYSTDRGELAKRMIDERRSQHIPGSITVYFDDKGNVPKIEEHIVRK